jgi:DNA photolyase
MHSRSIAALSQFPQPKHPILRTALVVFLVCSSGPRVVHSLSSNLIMKSANKIQANKKALVFHWFRLGDMRLHDNPALCKSILQADHIIPIFCFDPRIFGNQAKSRQDDLKCGPKRAQFVLESVADLRANLERKGSGLLVAHGKPEDFIPHLFQQLGNEALTNGKVICQREVCSEEESVVKAVEMALQTACSGRPKSSLLETVWGSTLYNIEDLPYQPGLTDLPDSVSLRTPIPLANLLCRTQHFVRLVFMDSSPLSETKWKRIVKFRRP